MSTVMFEPEKMVDSEKNIPESTNISKKPQTKSLLAQILLKKSNEDKDKRLLILIQGDVSSGKTTVCNLFTKRQLEKDEDLRGTSRYILFSENSSMLLEYKTTELIYKENYEYEIKNRSSNDIEFKKLGRIETINYNIPISEIGEAMATRHEIYMDIINGPGSNDLVIGELVREDMKESMENMDIIMYVIDSIMPFQQKSQENLKYILEYSSKFKRIRYIIILNKYDTIVNERKKKIVEKTKTIVKSILKEYKIDEDKYAIINLSAKYAFALNYIETYKSFGTLEPEMVDDVIHYEFGANGINDDEDRLQALLSSIQKNKTKYYMNTTGYGEFIKTFNKLIVENVEQIYNDKIISKLERGNANPIKDFEYILNQYSRLYEIKPIDLDNYVVKYLTMIVLQNIKNLDIDEKKNESFNRLILKYNKILCKFTDIGKIIEAIENHYKLLLYSLYDKENYFIKWKSLACDCVLLEKNKVIEILEEHFSNNEYNKNYIKGLSNINIDGLTLLSFCRDVKYDCSDLIISFCENIARTLLNVEYEKSPIQQRTNENIIINSKLMKIIIEECCQKFSNYPCIDRFKKFLVLRHVSVNTRIEVNTLICLTKLNDIIRSTFSFLNDFFDYVNTPKYKHNVNNEEE